MESLFFFANSVVESKILSMKHLEQLGTDVEQEPCLRIQTQEKVRLMGSA